MEQLVEGHEVSALVRKDSFSDTKLPDAVSKIEGDLLEKDLAEKVVKANPEVIVNLASFTPVRFSFDKAMEYGRVNYLGTVNLVEGARRCPNLKQFVHSSTMESYKAKNSTISEEDPLEGSTPYGVCFDSTTEVLTESGWKHYYELAMNERVATLNRETSTMEFQFPTGIYVFDYTGPMLLQKNRLTEFMVTPNHRVYAAYHREKERLLRPRFFQASETKGKPIIVQIAAPWTGGEQSDYFVLPGCGVGQGFRGSVEAPARNIPMDDWLRFLGWYLAEGHTQVRVPSGPLYRVTLSTYYRHAEALQMFRAIGLKAKVDASTSHHITGQNKQLSLYLEQFGHAHDKFVPPELKVLPRSQLTTLLEKLLEGDGDRNGDGWRYTTVSPRLANDVQEIALKVGWAAIIVRDKEGFYRVHLSRTLTAELNLGEDMSQWVPYSGKVWCVSVPNEVVLVRRNGKPCFSGNSKAAADLYVQVAGKAWNLPFTILRCGNTFGRSFALPEEARGYLVEKAVISMLTNKERVEFDGYPDVVRSWLYYPDHVGAYMAVIGNEKAVKKAYNAIAEAHSVGDMVQLIAHFTGFKGKVEWGKNPRPFDPPMLMTTAERIKFELGWRARFTIAEGLAKTVEYWRERL